MCVIIIIYTFKHNEQIILQLTNQDIAVCVRRRSAVGRSRISSIDEYVCFLVTRTIPSGGQSVHLTWVKITSQIYYRRETHEMRDKTHLVYITQREWDETLTSKVARRSSRADRRVRTTIHFTLISANWIFNASRLMKSTLRFDLFE